LARLAAATLAHLPPAIRRPRYDRAALAVGMAHLGVGAFHRCHQAEFTEDALEAEFGRWGIAGINLRPPRLGPMLGDQDGLYTRTVRRDGEAELRVIGCLREIVDGEQEAERALATLAAPDIALATLTVTEKAYCHHPATGRLDESHPDIVHDLAGRGPARSLPGIVVAALDRRRRRRGGPITLVSCDNIPANGRVLASVVRRFAELSRPDLGPWIADHVRFPSTMVDRIVPAATDDDRAFAAAAIGMEDRAAVVGEPFRQWVIEDDFAGPRPRWEAAGAELVGDVTPHELVKMRLLNGAQTTLSYLGALAGLGHTCDDVRDPLIAGFVRRMLLRETVPGLPADVGIDLGAYVERCFDRLANTAIRHTNHQIATDGSQKIVQRLLNPIRACIARGIGHELLAAAVAAWMAYLLAGTRRFGARWLPEDPWADAVRRIADETGPDAAALVRRIVALEPIFAADLAADEAFCASLARHLGGLLLGDPRRHLGALLAAEMAA